MSTEQKENHANTCQDLQGRLEKDPEFLLKIMKGDESDYWYNTETTEVLSVEEPIIAMPEKALKCEKYALFSFFTF
jgi:hypothetical protein